MVRSSVIHSDESAAGTDRARLAARFEEVRAMSSTLASPISPEDMQVQSMPDVSPTKWHLAHTSWFFETFVLPAFSDYRPADPSIGYLF